MTNAVHIALHEALAQQPYDFLSALGQNWGLQFRGTPPHTFLANELSKAMLDRSTLVARLAGMPEAVRKACLSLLEIGALPKKEFERQFGVITTFPKYLYQNPTSITLATALHVTGFALLTKSPGGRASDLVVIPMDLAEAMRGALVVTLASTLKSAAPPAAQFIDDPGSRLVTLVGHMLGFVLQNGVQYTKSGDIHRGYLTKITEHLYGKAARDAAILPGAAPAFLYQIMRLANICDEQEGSKVVLTAQGRDYMEADRLNQHRLLFQSWANQSSQSAGSSDYDPYFDSYSGWPYQIHHEVRKSILAKVNQFPVDGWVKLDQAALAMLSPGLSASTLNSYALRYFAWQGASGTAAAHAYIQDIVKATLIGDLRELGVVKIDRRSLDRDSAMLVSLTKLGAWLTGISEEMPRMAKAPVIVVQPSYEVIMPRDTSTKAIVTVESVAELVTRDIASTYNLTKARVGAALERGATIETIVTALEVATGQPLPSNVVHTLRDWAGVFGRVRVINSSVLVTDSASLMAELRVSKKLVNLLGDRLDERVCLIADRQAPLLVKKLREAGHLPVLQGGVSGDTVTGRVNQSAPGATFDSNELMSLFVALEICLSMSDLGGSILEEDNGSLADFETLQAKIHQMVPTRNRRQLSELASTVQSAIDQLLDPLDVDDIELPPDLTQPLQIVAREPRHPKS